MRKWFWYRAKKSLIIIHSTIEEIAVCDINTLARNLSRCTSDRNSVRIILDKKRTYWFLQGGIPGVVLALAVATCRSLRNTLLCCEMSVISKPWTRRTHRAHSLKSQQKETFSLPVAMREGFLSHRPYCLTELGSRAGVDGGIPDDHTTGGGIWRTRAGCRSMSNKRSAMWSEEGLRVSALSTRRGLEAASVSFSKAREERTSHEAGLSAGPSLGDSWKSPVSR